MTFLISGECIDRLEKYYYYYKTLVKWYLHNMGPWEKETRFLPKNILLMVMSGMDNSFFYILIVAVRFLTCVFSPAIWRTGRCRCTLRFMGKERRTWTVTGWPFGTLKNACRKVGTTEHQSTISTSVGIHIHLLSLLCRLLQVPYLETWTTSPAWACLWTHIPTRRSISRYAHTTPPGRYMWLKTNKLARASASHAETLLQRFEKGLCVLLCNHSATGAEEKVHAPHTGNLLSLTSLFRPPSVLEHASWLQSNPNRSTSLFICLCMVTEDILKVTF